MFLKVPFVLLKISFLVDLVCPVIGTMGFSDGFYRRKTLLNCYFAYRGITGLSVYRAVKTCPVVFFKNAELDSDFSTSSF